jgi:DNA-binding Xre family transcriptional regulator
MVLGTLAEQSLPMTMAPVLINLSKELAKDKKALQNLGMDRTTASYKMTHGLAKTIHERTMETLCTVLVHFH